MGSWTGFLLAYLLGGLTFLPLLIISVLAHAYYTLPYREDAVVAGEDAANDIVQPGDDTSTIRAAQEVHKVDYKARAVNQDSDVSAGYFAVCREYTPMGINAKPIERATPVGSATVAAPSPSVYQTMYRSLFERKQSPNPLDNKNPLNQRPKKAGNVFYVVLRHGHLMLFDDDEQLEVRHVISLAYHDVSIYSGGDVTPEGELFIKRNALCLSRRQEGPEVGPDSQLSKPFYLFSEDCSAKEDFYFALLRNQEETMATDRKAPVPIQFSIEHIISLVQKLHSSEDHTHSRWLNAFLGRVFLGVYQTRDLENFIREKITKKISRVKRPSFLSGIKIQGISLGEAAPTVTNPRLKDLTVEGECVAEADLRYTGGFRIEVAATARIDLGSRFKVREVPLVLAVVIKKLEGHILFRIKAPPSNRLWFSFQSMPKMEMTIEPIVSTRQITYTLILRQIENRIKEVIAESVVQPFWDDVPFFKTEHKKWRGGIFRDDDAVAPTKNIEDDAAQHGQVDTVDTIEESGETLDNMRPMEKSHSLPMLENSAPTGLFGRKLTPSPPGVTRTASNSSLRGTRLRHVTEANGESEHKSALDREVSAISTATSRSHNDSPTHTPSGSPTRPSQQSAAASSASSLDIKGAETDSGRIPNLEGEPTPLADTGRKLEEEEAKSPVSSLKSNSGSLSRGLFRRQDSSASTASGLHQGNDGATKRGNTLAAVTKAAVTARTWGWNALQRRAEGGKDELHPDGNSSVDLSQPMGRGRPLPPPGVPLPPPERTTKPGRTKTTPIAPPNRKPVQPPRPKQHPEAERAEKVNGHRPVPPPPLPKRRLMADAPEVGDNLLVVAAPEDSQPASPSTEDPPTYKHPWVEDADDSHMATPKPNAAEHPDHREHQSSMDEADDVDYDHEDGSHGPITAIPVVDTESDDEGYSGWIDNSGDVDDATTEEGHVTPAMAIERYLAS